MSVCLYVCVQEWNELWPAKNQALTRARWIERKGDRQSCLASCNRQWNFEI